VDRIFSGVVSQMPIKINVKALNEESRPQSSTRKLSEIVPDLEFLPLD
jgi:uncharacterized protein